MKAVRAFDASSVEKPHGFGQFVWPDEFKRRLPLDLEIGCGVGWHPIQYAKANPDRLLVAIEHTRAKFESFERRAQNHPQLTNLLPVHADAVRWVTHALKPHSIDRIFLMYPNPEPKAPNKRWLRMPFFAKLLEVLKPDGTITLATNIEAYMSEAIDYASEVWNLRVVERRTFTKDSMPPGGPRTHFEKKYLARGEACFDVTFSR